MKILDGVIATVGHEVRGYWHIVQDTVCLVACILASSASFPYYTRANNLFIFFTVLTLLSFLFKSFRTDLYKKSVKKLGAWGSKYRCFYAIYYPTIAFLCASLGGFKGYSFALIWILSGGTYLVIADQIAREEKDTQDIVADQLTEKITNAKEGCPYCKSKKYTTDYVKELQNLKAKNTCSKCGKHWHQIFKYVDVELLRDEIPVDEQGDEEIGVLQADEM
jgi:hypothetical protein